MNANINTQIVLFFRFMRLFGITEFRLLECQEARIDAMVGWQGASKVPVDEDEEIQAVRWLCLPPERLADALLLGEYAQLVGAIDIDRVSLVPARAQAALQWEPSRFDEAYENLLAIRVPMLDEGTETDIFFLHP